MPKLLLRNGDYAVVDQEDYTDCLKYSWGLNVDGYAYTTGTVYLHRHILKAKRGQIADHINGDRLDCRRSNLRLVTSSQNSMNKKKRKDNTSGYKGVSWNKTRQKWIAYIHQAGKMVFLGTFTNQKDAVTARMEAEQKLFGKFSRMEKI